MMLKMDIKITVFKLDLQFQKEMQVLARQQKHSVSF